MCGASKIAQHHDPAEENTTLAIGKIGLHGGGALGAFHRREQEPSACIICVQSGTMLTLENITPHLRKKFGLGATAIAEFIETPRWHDDDRLVFVNGKDVPLIAFADHGVTAFVGIKTETDADPVNRVVYDTPAMRPFSGVLATHGEGRATA